MSGKKNRRKRREERRQNTSTIHPPAHPSEPSTKNGRRENQDDHGDTKKRKRMGDFVNGDEEAAKCLVFQDVMKAFLDPGKANDNETQEEDFDEDTEVSNTMFELANSPLVGFRVGKLPDSKDGTKAAGSKDLKASSSSCTIAVKQDINACNNHTGGIVWETAYLLLQYLQTKENLGTTLEVGAGCGMLGQVLAAQRVAKIVVMTEHKDVVPNLASNLKRNKAQLLSVQASPVHVCELDWEQFDRDVHLSKDLLKPHACDTILGTDVVFSIKLVEPLWKTLQFMSHSKTNIYLCLQERCAASHRLLLEKAAVYGFDMKDISTQFGQIPSCQWGSSLECKLFHITQIQ